MKKMIAFGLSCLLLLTACQKANVEEGKEDSINQEEEIQYLGILLDKNLYLFRGEKEENYELIYLSNEIKNVKIGEMIKFHIDGPILESYPLQAKAKDIEVIPGRVKGLSIDLEKAENVKAFGGEKISLLDVRTLDEYNSGHLEEAEHMPLDRLAMDIEEKKDKDQVLFVYCRSGVRSKEAQKILEDLGYFTIDAGGLLDK